MIEIIAQIFGFFGAGLNALSFQQSKRKGILSFQIAAALMFIIHYILLGAFTGAALNLIAMLRSIVFINNNKKWAKSSVWLIVFVALSAVSSAITWNDWTSILPAIAMSLTTVSYWLKNETQIRFVTFPSSPCWLIYNCLNGSIAGIITEIIVMTSLVIGIIRYDILRKAKNKKYEN